MQRITLGGDRLGSGKKMKVDLHGYERSTHNLSKIWRSTMSAGTLVPFMKLVGLPGDTFDINLDCDVLTHPTIGPLFGSYKVQLDVFQAPIRLYQAKLHNNALNIGRNMAEIKLPKIKLWALPVAEDTWNNADNAQINPSCILSYLGIRGVGFIPEGEGMRSRDFNAVPFLAYWDIYKNYYANKQEEIGAVLDTARQQIINSITSVTTNDLSGGGNVALPQAPLSTDRICDPGTVITLNYTGAPPITSQIKITVDGNVVPLLSIFGGELDSGTAIFLNYLPPTAKTVSNWDYINFSEAPLVSPGISTFPLSNIDEMRERILTYAVNNLQFYVNSFDLMPYTTVAFHDPAEAPPAEYEVKYIQTQQGLGLKTYQSDLFNNWLSTDWIDGPGGINEITAISTAGGSFTIDTLNLSKKVYDMLNRIAVSDGSYGAWLSATYDHTRFIGIESPVYHGGLIKELVFQEVVSNALSEEQPLGTLAGKGTMAKKHKGGNVHIKVDEPCYIMGIISLTPRIDYSQGNHWDTHLSTMDDFHKPALDGIGFQELMTEQMAWWDTYWDSGWVTKSAGKQPAWINYMTDYNETRGNFAIDGNEMFMTLNRRYELSVDGSNIPSIEDLTTYIDPSKFNNIFAQTSIDAQNFWVQIAMDVIARRKMSARVMPNL